MPKRPGIRKYSVEIDDATYDRMEQAVSLAKLRKDKDSPRSIAELTRVALEEYIAKKEAEIAAAEKALARPSRTPAKK